MRIGESQSVRGSAGIERLRPALAAVQNGTATESQPVQDMTSVLGIPEPEFTPKVQEAIYSLLEEVGKLRQELAQSKQRIAQLEKLADEDALVPIPNRRAFVSELSRMLSFAQRYGDAAIVHVADMLAASIRESDIVGRLGGDEFGIILANAPESEAVQKAAQLGRTISTTPFKWKGQNITVTISSGAYALQGGEDASAMLDNADQAMYAQKPLARLSGG